MGRPREFQEEQAIDRVTEAFWANGYARTSLEDLIGATGVSRSSLYNAFGGKLDLFCAALDRYRAGPAQEVLRPLREETGARALRHFLERLSDFVESPEAGRGCLMVNTLAEGEIDAAVAARVRAHFQSIRDGIEKAYAAAVREDELPPQGSPRAVADWLLVVVRGVLLGAGSGEDPGALQRSLRLTQQQLGVR